MKLEHNCTIPPPFSLHQASSWNSPPFPATPLCHSQLLQLLPSSSPGSASHHHQLLLSFFLHLKPAPTEKPGSRRGESTLYLSEAASLSLLTYEREFPAEYEELRISGGRCYAPARCQLMGHFNNKSHHPPSPSCSMYFCSTTSSFCRLRRSSAHIQCLWWDIFWVTELANCPFLDSHSHS